MKPADRGHGVALARAALAGNPSDPYGGAVLAVTLEQFQTEAIATRSPAPEADPPSELVSATIARFARTVARGTAKVSWNTSIPKSVGLGGSSAIVIATLRALCELHAVALEPDRLAELALSIETEDLGIAAGPQDRIAQAYGGLTFMDFSGPGTYEPLDRALLPPLVIAWLRDAAASSSDVHSELRARADEIRPVMAELAGAARAARTALLRKDHAEFAAAVDRSFDLRAEVMGLDPRHVAMIECARQSGAAANYTGSGGAIVAVCGDYPHRDHLLAELAREGLHRITV